jgi:putative ABC transport system permease protein
VTVAGAVLAGFAFASVAQASADRGYLPAHTLEVSGGRMPGPERTAALERTVESVVGPVELSRSAGLTAAGSPRGYLKVGGIGVELRSADEQRLLDQGVDDPGTLQRFRAGAVVVVGPRAARAVDDDGAVTVRLAGAGEDTRWRLPAVAVKPNRDARELGSVALVSTEQAGALGLRTTWGELRFRTSGPVTDGQLDRLAVHGISGWSDDPERLVVERMQFAGLAVAGVLSLLVVGVAVALAAAESRDDVATLAAVGAGPWRRRSMGAMHGLFLGLLGAGLGAVVGVPAGAALTQVDGLSGVDAPWLATAGTLLVVLLSAPVAGWLVTPSRLRLTRRTA